MNAAFMSFQQHERGIHVVWSGAGEADMTKVCSRRAAVLDHRPTTPAGQSISGRVLKHRGK
jgi:hypothetical protein